MSDLGVYGEIAWIKRELRAIRQEIRPRGATPASAPELGEVTGVAPLVIERSDGTAVTVDEVFGGSGTIGDPALVLYPEDAGAVAVLPGSAGGARGMYIRSGTATWSASAGSSSVLFPTGQGSVNMNASWASVDVSGAVVLDPGLYIVQWHLGWSTGSVTGIIESQMGFSYASTTIDSTTVFGKNSGTNLNLGNGALSIYVSNRTTGTISNPSYALTVMRIGDES